MKCNTLEYVPIGVGMEGIFINLFYFLGILRQSAKGGGKRPGREGRATQKDNRNTTQFFNDE